jgi:tetratricopeptide (TPR) repeat protein
MNIPEPAAAPATAAPLLPASAPQSSWLRGCLKAVRARRPSSGRAFLVVAALAAIVGAGVYLVRQFRASQHFRAAQTEFRQHHYGLAKDHLQFCVAVWPHDPATLLLAARLARRTNAYEHASHFLDQYLALRGNDDDLLLERALLRCERGEVDDVIAFCSALIERQHAETPLILEALAFGLMRKLRVHEAKLVLHQWLELEPNCAQAQFMIGEVWQMVAQHQPAVEAFEHAVALDPDHSEARFRLAGALLDMSQPREALPHLQKLILLQPKRVPVLVELAKCYDRLGYQNQAETLLERALELQPKSQPALQERGYLAFRRDQPEKAEFWLRQATELAPGNYQLHYQLSLCLQRLGKTEEANAMLPWLKQLEADTRRLPEIIKNELPRSPKDANLLHELGAISLRAGWITEALRWFDAALEADPQHVATHEAYADFYQRTDQPSRAAKHREFLKAKSDK